MFSTQSCYHNIVLCNMLHHLADLCYWLHVAMIIVHAHLEYIIKYSRIRTKLHVFPHHFLHSNGTHTHWWCRVAFNPWHPTVNLLTRIQNVSVRKVLMIGCTVCELRKKWPISAMAICTVELDQNRCNLWSRMLTDQWGLRTNIGVFQMLIFWTFASEQEDVNGWKSLLQCWRACITLIRRRRCGK